MSSQCQAAGCNRAWGGPLLFWNFSPFLGLLGLPSTLLHPREVFCFLLSSNPSIKSSFTMKEGMLCSCGSLWPPSALSSSGWEQFPSLATGGPLEEEGRGVEP